MAASGAAWTIATGLGSRGLGLVGTLVLTYWVARDELGEVSDAAVAVLLANQLSTVGAGQYYISRSKGGRDVAWHATVLHVSLGVAAMLAVLALRQPLSVWLRAPSLERFLPGLLVSGLLERFAYMPERVLARGMRFRQIGLCRTAGELAYTATSVGLAAVGWGEHRSSRGISCAASCGWQRWLGRFRSPTGSTGHAFRQRHWGTCCVSGSRCR